MQTQPSNNLQPTLPAMRLLLYAASLLVLAVGIPLYLLSEHTDVYFAYTVNPPLGAAFFGAAYWSSFVLEFLSARERLWANARSAVPAVFAFTGLILLISLVHLDRFHLTAPQFVTWFGTWVWFAVYAIVPVIMAVLLVRQSRARGESPPRVFPLPQWVRIGVGVAATLLIGLGVVFLVAPGIEPLLWPWPMMALGARIIGAWLIGLGLSSAAVTRENDLMRVRPVIYSTIVFSLLEFIALARYPDQVNWGGLSIWLYILILTAFLVAGLASAILIRRAAPLPSAQPSLR
ncbi:MAG: hypothetical protein WCF84_07160 [Anaerolineae bacterium]